MYKLILTKSPSLIHFFVTADAKPEGQIIIPVSEPGVS